MKTARVIFETIMSTFALIFIITCGVLIMYIFAVAVYNGNPTVRIELDMFMEFKPELILLSFLFSCFCYKLKVLHKLMFQELDKMIRQQKRAHKRSLLQLTMVDNLDKFILELEE